MSALCQKIFSYHM